MGLEETPLAAASLRIDRPDEGILLVHLAGSWRLGEELPPLDDLRRELTAARPAQLRFDTRDLDAWDTGLLTALRHIFQDCGAQQIETDRGGLPEGARRLLALAEAVPEALGTGRAAHPASFLARIGEAAIGAVRHTVDFLAFLGQATLAVGRLLRGRATFPRAEFGAVLQEVGADALPIVSLISFLVGLILAFMGAIQLKQFGAEIYVANLVGIGMARDMGPIMAGIIMAGRTGAAFAAQIGTMTVNEEVDALRTMGIDPMEYLVLPRMLALVLMMPLLALYADVLGILGGMAVCVSALDIGATQYIDQTLDAVTIQQFASGLFKGGVYGVIVAISGCLRGVQCGRSAAAVGSATTSAVVTGIVFIVVACGVITVVYDVLGI